jgi:hypothetical protein
MQPSTGLKKIQSFFEALQSKYTLNRCFRLLSLFLLAVILISFIFPALNFGRFFGTDDYTHLFQTKEMVSSNGIADFYERMGTHVSNPGSGENLYNYPFGLWIFGATIAKITGIPPVTADFLFVIVFLFIILSSFYVYSGTFLKSKEQKILAVLFLLCMPNAALTLLSYRPSIFILPFLFILLYITFKEPIPWKLFPVAWLSIFIITISHTGTFIFILMFFLLFFLLYCLLWGRFSLSSFIVILSTFVIYIFSIGWFPQIANQYEVKSILLLSPGNFLATNFNFTLPLELGTIFYQNMLVNLEFIYIIILGGFIFSLGKLFIYIHRKVSTRFSQLEQVYPVTLPISNISHSVVATPLWIGPIHVIFSFIGFFRIDGRGKCMLVTTLVITLLPDMLSAAQNEQVATGALREISYLFIIIPLTAVLGFWTIISYMDTLKNVKKNLIQFTVWVLVLSAIIITPVIATTYYLPKISGEDYVIDGMKWLGDAGDLQAGVANYGYRTVAIYTDMTDVSYGLQNGWETRTYLKLLKSIYFSTDMSSVSALRGSYGVKYILTSDYLARNLQGTLDNLMIDKNPALDKIYSSKDFGVYEITTSAQEIPASKMFMADNITFQQTGSSIQIETDAYKIVLNDNYPIMERFGTANDNYLGEGTFDDYILISGLRQQTIVNPFSPLIESASVESSMYDMFDLNSMLISPEITNNQVTYRAILKDQQTGENEASLLVRYTFYPKTIKREFLITNDWVTSPVAPDMKVSFRTRMNVPLNDFVMKNDKNQIKRHIYPALDNVLVNEIFQDLYIHDGNRGIYIKYEPTTGYPSQLIYKGSTLYNNMSILLVSQSEYLQPGSTLHVTQFLSPGDEVTAEREILDQADIYLSDYPDGITPIILSGYRTSSSDIGINDAIEQGYRVLLDEEVPYSEVVIPFVDQNLTTSGVLNITPQVTTTIDLRTITDAKIIVSGRTGTKYFDNFSTQEASISSLVDYANRQNMKLIGYIPGSLSYNLDTLKIISDKKIPFMISRAISSPSGEFFGLEKRDPQMASYRNESLDLVLLPLSYPMSTALSYKSTEATVFSQWKATIDEAAHEDKMTLFIIRSEDIGNPEYTEDIIALIAYAKNKGLTFTSPDTIVDHYKNIQKIQYSGSVDGDTATINMTNNNEDMVQNVTFRIVLPNLKTGDYTVNNGNIIKTKKDNNQIVVYASTDIPAYATKEITIEPDAPRQKIVVTMPLQPAEGPMTISIKDSEGNPLRDADVIIDSKYYSPDADGNVKIDATRGIHTVRIQYPGYETYSTNLNVKGRYSLIQQFFSNIT